MANMQEKGTTGATIAPRPPSGHPTQRRKPAKVVPRQPRSKVLSGGGSSSSRRRTKQPVYRQQALQRRASGTTSSRRTRSSAPRKPAPQTSKTITPPAPPKPAPPNNATWLRSDSVYQRQLAAYAKSLADFQADQGLARTDYDTGYQNTFRDIGLAKADASEDLKNDYAARGMLQSSLYNEGLGELNTQYQNQFNDLSKQRTSFLDQLGQELTKYKNEQGSQQSNAMQEALRRRAEKYNL
jgi:hypothetical protein